MGWSVFEGRPAAAKLCVIGLTVLGLMIPLSMLRGLISERSQMRSQAVQTVAKGWGGSLTMGGPLLRIPFEVESKSSTGEVTRHLHQLFILADSLSSQSAVDQTTTRRIGIYGVPVYLLRAKLSGAFKMTDVVAAAAMQRYPTAVMHWNEAAVRLPLSDVRSVREFGSALIAQRVLTFGPAATDGIPGVEARVDLSELLHEEGLPFSAQLVLAGSQSLNFVPTAATSSMDLASDWPDPEFQGAFLPAQYTIDQHGFHAHWQVLSLNRTFAQSWVDDQVDCQKFAASAYGIELFQSIDVYQRSERAVKYALLFISLTFLAFFAWESLGKVHVHAVQYLLIGLALSTFYLLLIALSEHIPFWLSYWLGASALVGLIGFYMSGAMRSARLGAVIAVTMSLVYGLLFMLVLSESYALLIGAIALFFVLATVMIATRKLRWDLQPP